MRYAKNHDFNLESLLKLIAIIAMTLDHVGLFFLSDNSMLRVIGRLALPIFGFFMGKNLGLSKSSSVLRYNLILPAFLVQILMYALMIDKINILFSFLLSSCFVKYYRVLNLQYLNKSIVIIILTLGLYSIFSELNIEYKLLPFVFMTIGYISVNTRSRKVFVILTIVSFVLYFIYTYREFSEYFGNYGLILFLLEMVVLCLIFICLDYRVLIYIINPRDNGMSILDMFMYFFEQSIKKYSYVIYCAVICIWDMERGLYLSNFLFIIGFFIFTYIKFYSLWRIKFNSISLLFQSYTA